MYFSYDFYKYRIFSLAACLLMSDLAFAKTKKNAKKNKEDNVVEQVIEPSASSEYVNARINFGHKNYYKSIAFLNNPTNDKEKLLLAESYFRLNNFVKAKELFYQVYDNLESPNDKKVCLIRIFECALALGDKIAAEKIYQLYVKLFKKPPEKLVYALAYSFIKTSPKKAAKLLRKIPSKSEYAIRSRYLLASMNVNKLAKKPASIAIKPFANLEQMIPVSLEDHDIILKAKLAKARIYAQRYMYDEAFKVYSEIGFSNEDITKEALEVLIKKSDDVIGGLGPYKNVDQKMRSLIEYQSIKKIFEIVAKFKENNGNDFFSSKIVSLIASLYGRLARYDEGKIFFDAVLTHYDSIKAELELLIKKPVLLPVFSLTAENKSNKNIINNISDFHLSRSEQINELLNIKNNIIKTKNEIVTYENKISKENADFSKFLLNQKNIEDDYLQKAIKLQSKVLKETLINVENFRKEILYQRAMLSDLESKDFKKQLDIVWDYDTKNQQNFNETLKKMQQENSNETSKEVKNGGSL